MTVAATAEKTTAAVELTELEKIEPTRVDGVGTPANGFPILMMKSITVDPPAGPEVPKEKAAPTRPAGVLGKAKRKAALAVVEQIAAGELAPVQLAKDAAGYDESADIAGAFDVIARIGALICSEATALGTGRMEEAYDICCLMQAVDAMQTFLCREQSQDDGSGTAAGVASADDDLGGGVSYLAQSAADEAAKSEAEPVGAEAKKGHGKHAGKKTKKGAILTVSEPHESEAPITPDVIKQAVAEAVAASEDRLKAVEAELAKVLATPIPGGPHLVTSQNRAPAQDPRLEKAARLRRIAAQTSDPDTKRSYLDLAAREEGAPITKG